MRKQFLAGLLSLAWSNAMAADAGYKGNPAITGPCYAVHGDIFLSADAGPVLGPDNSQSHHGLTIRAAPESDADTGERLQCVGR